MPVGAGHLGFQHLAMRIQAAEKSVRRASLSVRNLGEPRTRSSSQWPMFVEQYRVNVLGIAKRLQILAQLIGSARPIYIHGIAQELALQRFDRRNLPRRTHSHRRENRQHDKQRLRQPERQEDFEEEASHRVPFLLGLAIAKI